MGKRIDFNTVDDSTYDMMQGRHKEGEEPVAAVEPETVLKVSNIPQS